MRRKSDRTASKKTKPSPEKKEKVEKVKRPRTRRRKQSTTSESESAEEPAQTVQKVEVVESQNELPPKSVKEDSPEESQEQVWHVKATETSGDVGEIKKLKICLARPPSTPERVDRSPRSKRKHSRATSSSDIPSVESEDKKKPKHRSRRGAAEVKDIISDKNQDSQGDEAEVEAPVEVPTVSESSAVCKESKSVDITVDETPMSTTCEDDKVETTISETVTQTESKDIETSKLDVPAKSSDADTTVLSPKPQADNDNVEKDTSEIDEKWLPEKGKRSSIDEEIKERSSIDEEVKERSSIDEEVKETPSKNEISEKGEVCESEENITHETEKAMDSNETTVSSGEGEVETEKVKEAEENSKEDKSASEEKISKDEQKPNDLKEEVKTLSPKKNDSPIRKRSLSTEKSEILELHAEESRCDSTEMCLNEAQENMSQDNQLKEVNDVVSSEVSINETSTEISENTTSIKDAVSTNEHNVVESSKKVETIKQSADTAVDNSHEKADMDAEVVTNCPAVALTSEPSNMISHDIHNGQATPAVTSRKRRWGSRPNRLSTQKSITISTDILKEIIPDVKPTEFEEVIEETKHKRVEVSEKVERPVLPKIVIDNTEIVENVKKDHRLDERDKENVKSRDTNLATSRKISIVKENDSIIARPPSPPRHKQSNILYITNLVRPFTILQLKNLLQRTGRIMENGFWMDKIKSKCFVKYENEDQAIETRHALHGVTWPVSNPKTLHVDFSTEEDFNKAQENVGTENTQTSTIPGTVEDWLREQDMKREKGDGQKPWERKAAMREWDMGKNDKDKEVSRPEKMVREERPLEKRRHRTPERSPEPARKFKKKEEEAPAKLLDDLFRKTKTTPCIYWLPLSAETIAVKEEQRRQHMAEHERRLQELRRNRRH
ncbi:acinus [Danaus plexippus plexippus]|uniref:Acinus n=1 Tax=Danaus plexippus plexippus TaxID=278856 RepID=A0A212F643_DANPL|nr:acinus [Danaus plexippus plexippus]